MTHIIADLFERDDLVSVKDIKMLYRKEALCCNSPSKCFHENDFTSIGFV